MDLPTPELQRLLQRMFKHNRIIAKHVAGSKKELEKLSKAMDHLTPKLQRTLQPIIEHNQIAPEHFAMVDDMITQIRAEGLKKNQGKLSEALDLLTPKLQRNLQIAAEHLAMANGTITQIMAAQASLGRRYTKRLRSQTGILKARDANRSIASRKAKDAAAQKRKLQKQWEKVHGKKPPPAPTQESDISIEAARVAEENGQSSFFDSRPI